MYESEMAAKAVYANQGGAMAPERDRSQVEVQMARLMDAVGSVGQCAEALCERLQPVQQQSAPVPGKERASAQNAVSLSPLADTLRGQAERLEFIAMMLTGHRSRLEI